MSPFAKKIGIISLLTALFLLDDTLIFLLLKNIYNWKIDPLLFGLGATIVVALNVPLAFLVFRIMRKKPTTGEQGMVGKIGVVIEKINGQGKVKIQGEIWKAECEEPLKAGEKITVERVEGLTLFVKKNRGL